MKFLQKIFYTILITLWGVSYTHAEDCENNFAFDASICEGQEFIFNSKSLFQTGIYTDTLTNSNGCDSIIQLNLSVIEPKTTRLNPTICKGETFKVGNNTYYQNGIYTDTLVSHLLCDSIIITNLIVNEASIENIDQTICSGQSFQVGQNIYNQTGIYTDTLTNSNGCDSIIQLNLSVIEPKTTRLNPIICKGETFKVGNNTYYQNGIYTDTLVSHLLCDSIVITNLIVKSPTIENINQTICNGQSFQVGQNSYNQTGIYTDTLSSVLGCDSIIILQLTVQEQLKSNQTIQLCDGQSYEINNHIYNTEGIYIDTLISQGGCDSIITTHLFINPKYEHYTEISFCEGDTIIFGDTIIQTTGFYTKNFPTIYHCDSIVHLSVNVFEKDFITQKLETCKDDFIQIDGIDYKRDTVFQQHYTNTLGCDSIVEYQLIFHPKYNFEIETSVCKESIYQGVLITNDTSFTRSYQSIYGCDSIITFTVKVEDIIETIITQDICFGTKYKGITITKDTVFTNTYNTVSGCDSIVTENIHVLPAVEMTVSSDSDINPGENITLFASGTETYLWSTGSTSPSIVVSPDKTTTYTVSGYNAEGCSQVKEITITVNSCEITTSNYFTPNGDGKNDIWQAKNLDCLNDFSLIIFNRWGNTVFKTNDTSKGWDGQYKNSSAPEGVYYYIIEGLSKQDRNLVQKSGYIHLER